MNNVIDRHNTITTINNTFQTGFEYLIKPGEVVGIDVKVVGKDFTDQTSSYYHRAGNFEWVSDDSPKLVGSVNNLITPIRSLIMENTDVTIDTSGGKIRVRIKGLSNTEIKWFIKTEIIKVK